MRCWNAKPAKLSNCFSPSNTLLAHYPLFQHVYGPQVYLLSPIGQALESPKLFLLDIPRKFKAGAQLRLW